MLAQRIHQRGLAGADRAADADAQGTVCGFAHERNSLVYWVSCNMLARSARKRGAADVVERRGQRPLRGRLDDRLQRGEHALAVGLAERDEPHAGRNQIGGDRMQKACSAGSSAMPWPAAATPTATG